MNKFIIPKIRMASLARWSEPSPNMEGPLVVYIYMCVHINHIYTHILHIHVYIYIYIYIYYITHIAYILYMYTIIHIHVWVDISRQWFPHHQPSQWPVLPPDWRPVQSPLERGCNHQEMPTIWYIWSEYNGIYNNKIYYIIRMRMSIHLPGFVRVYHNNFHFKGKTHDKLLDLRVLTFLSEDVSCCLPLFSALQDGSETNFREMLGKSDMFNPYKAAGHELIITN